MKKNIITYHRYHDSRGRSFYGSDQVAISAKIDSGNMAAMDAEMATSGVKRNRLINLAVKWYLEELDEAREKSALGNVDDKYILSVDMADLTGEELEALRHICRSFGCTQDVLVRHLIRMMVHDYDKNPYRYMP